MNFKQYLMENDTSHFIKGQELEDYVEQHKHYMTLQGNEVKFEFENLELTHSMIIDGYIPVQFKPVRNYYVPVNIELKSLVGSPQLVNNCEIRFAQYSPINSMIGGPKIATEVFKIIDFHSHITSLDGIAEKAHVYRNYISIPSYQNVHKHIKEIGSIIEITNRVVSNMLGFVLIKGNFNIVVGGENDKLKEAINILNNDTTKDVLEVQEELITNGLKEFAKL
jgi:hypothetical protein